MEGFLNQNLQINIIPKAVTKIGEKACVIELENDTDKRKIMINKSKLKSLKDLVFIKEDLTKNEKEKQKQIRQFTREEKEKGNEVKIGYNKVIVDGEEWRWNSRTDKIEKQEPKN